MKRIVLPTGTHLTASEASALKLMFEGNTAKSAGDMLCVSERTVQYHLNSVYRKLNTHSVMQTLCQLQTLGMLETVMRHELASDRMHSTPPFTASYFTGT